ncbi:MAG: AI-2E family transporter, partial [Limnothrix sp. RL_2_0]|nr:AI-2E family transporter [Limnothrix sp. RL_2_0]
ALQLFGFFESELTAIITATLLSFLLAYPVRTLKQRFGVRHQLSVVFVMVLAVFCLLLIGFTLIPLVFDQVTNLSARFPALIDSGTVQLKALEEWAIAHNSPLRVDMLAQRLEAYLSSQAKPLSNLLLQLFPTAFESVLHWVLVLILTLYLLLHGDRFWAGLLRFLPTHWGDRLQKTTRQTFQNYFVGQLTVAIIVAIAMTLALVLLGVPFALVFGLSIGVLALFPFGKTLGVVFVSVIVSLQSIWLGLRVAGVVILLDQCIDNFIVPILISRFTALNPIWILLSLLFGVKIAGLLGLVLAVPVAGTIKALLEPVSPAGETPQNLDTLPPTTDPEVP